jgi:hypothetical protein
MNLRFARMYANREIISLKAGNHMRIADPRTFLTQRQTYNVVKACVDSACAKISKDKPRPLFLTENGSWTLQQKAKRLSQFIQAVFATMGTGTGENKSLYGIGRQAFKDAGIFGTGSTFFFVPNDSNEVKAERVFIDEIIIEDMEGQYMAPRQMHRVKQVPREILLNRYPKKAMEIAQAEVTEAQMRMNFIASDMIDISESWHLQSGKDTKDGKHAICIKNCTLDSENFDDPTFDFLFQRWCMPILGFWGTGISEELCGIQLEISKILRVIQISQHLMSVPQVWLEYQSQVATKTINNEIGGLKYYVGKAPIFATPGAVNPELYEHLERLYARAFELTGISQLSASGKIPQGMDAAIALRTMQDIENERFSLQQAMYEDYFMDATALILRKCRKLKEEGRDPVVQFKDGNTMKKIRFSDVDIEDQKIMVRAYPTNFLPSTPAGKLSDVKDFVEGGFYTPEEALELFDYPDLKKINNLKTSGRDDVLKVIEKMIETEKYISPEPYMNLELAKTISQSYYLRCKCDEAPENVLDLLRTFMEDIRVEIEKKAAQQAPPQQALPAPMIAPPIEGQLAGQMPPGPPMQQPIPMGV